MAMVSVLAMMRTGMDSVTDWTATVMAVLIMVMDVVMVATDATGKDTSIHHRLVESNKRINLAPGMLILQQPLCG